MGIHQYEFDHVSWILFNFNIIELQTEAILDVRKCENQSEQIQKYPDYVVQP